MERREGSRARAVLREATSAARRRSGSARGACACAIDQPRTIRIRLVFRQGASDDLGIFANAQHQRRLSLSRKVSPQEVQTRDVGACAVVLDRKAAFVEGLRIGNSNAVLPSRRSSRCLHTAFGRTERTMRAMTPESLMSRLPALVGAHADGSCIAFCQFFRHLTNRSRVHRGAPTVRYRERSTSATDANETLAKVHVEPVPTPRKRLAAAKSNGD